MEYTQITVWRICAYFVQIVIAFNPHIVVKIRRYKLGDGVDLRQNYRPFMQKGKLSVRHIHFHLVPRTQDDYIYQVSEKYDTELFASLDPSEAKEVRKLLDT
jgi:diadenosine tetraphosphate (Ap4A) HIT family hydrolase